MGKVAEEWTAGPVGGHGGRLLFGVLLVGLIAAVCDSRPASTLDYVAGVASTSSQREIGEWAATASGSSTGTAFFASILLVIVVLALSDRWLKPIELLLLISFAALGHQALRMVIWWAKVMAPVTARENWQEILDEYEVDLVVWNHRMSDAVPGVLQRSPKWKIAYRDDLAAIYVRAD